MAYRNGDTIDADIINNTLETAMSANDKATMAEVTANSAAATANQAANKASAAEQNSSEAKNVAADANNNANNAIATLSKLKTVTTTLPPGAPATSNISGAVPNLTLNLGIPAAEKPTYSFSEILGTATPSQLPAAGGSAATKGAVYAGDNIIIDSTGKVSANFGTVAPYVQSVTWSGSVGNYSYTRTASQHGKGANPSVKCYLNNVEIDCEARVAANGDVTVYANANVSGVIVNIR